MLARDEDSLVCDLAEVYNIYDYRSLPPTKVATFACGLRQDSRIMLAMAEQDMAYESVVLAGILDRLSILVWQNSKAGVKGTNKPKSLVASMLKKKQTSTYSAVDDIDAELARRRRRYMELAKAYVQIIPTSKGVSKSVGDVLQDEGIDEAARSSGTSAGASFGSGLVKTIGALAIGAKVADVFKSSLEEGAALQQSIGGIETLFGDSADKMKDYAANAYKTAGLSANDYMEQTTSFAASLLQSLGGDTDKAADVANRAMIDMSDNANKMGTSMESITNAYQGFAKQNYTMLDNLKLGYGGTKEEMARLIADTAEMTDIQDKLGVSVDASDMSFGNIINAISVMQEKLNITGTTTEEAAKTMEGSMKSMQASWHNLLGNIATGGDLTGPLTQLGATAATFVTQNLIPMIGNILSALPQALGTVLKQIAETLPNILNTLLTSLGELMKGLGDFDWAGLISTVIDSITTFFEGDGLSNFLIMGFQATASLAQGLIENLPKIIDSITNLIDSLVTWISDHLDEIIAAGVQIVVALSVGLLKAVPKLLEAVPKLVGAIGGSILEVDWIGVGIDIVRGIISGIQSMGSALWQAMKDIAKSCYQSVLDFFSIGSPSRLMRDTVGVMIPAGMAIGIDNGADLAVGAIEDMNDEVYGAISLPDYGALGYSTDYTPAGVTSSEPTMAGEYSETSMQPINVYIGQDKLDTVLAKANARMTYRAGR